MDEIPQEAVRYRSTLESEPWSIPTFSNGEARKNQHSTGDRPLERQRRNEGEYVLGIN